ncbi:alpha/beta hydrolase [Chamaesiphon sp. VAR_48_metabat_135_sub]|uniref:alpha/beta fold hydrolase n=1 Tax=Chamaesiphon sp. VAR_48_metabat_135_sub TaxID=2964699 RepID=UPI00286C7F7D|nr:alpha/beta hydrolase [Chamaesiphon sp. VAR_48_metabat_135_sub]
MQLHSPSFFQPRTAQPHLPLFVFFPGMDGTGQLYHTQIDRLAAKFDIRCLKIASNDRTNWSELVDRSLQLITKELPEGREAYFCGESFGACLAMQVAGQMSAKIGKLVLINPASSFGRWPWLASGSALSGLLPDALYPLSARILMNFLVSADRVAAAERQSLLDAMLSVQPQTAAWRLNLLRQFQVDSVVPKIIDIPTVLIAGGLDRLLPSPLEVRFLGRMLPKSKTTLLPYSGHACLLEQDINLVDLL